MTKLTESSASGTSAHREWVREVLSCSTIEEAHRLVQRQYPDETSDQIDQRISTLLTSGQRKVPKAHQPPGLPPEVTAARKAARTEDKKKRRHARQIDAVEKRLAAAHCRSVRDLGKGE